MWLTYIIFSILIIMLGTFLTWLGLDKEKRYPGPNRLMWITLKIGFGLIILLSILSLYLD